MRFIGRIISFTRIEDVSEFIEVTSDASSIVDNATTIPTLIIGYKKAQELCGEVNILKKQISTNLWWTFSKRERRIDFESDLKDFLKRVAEFIKTYSDYRFFSLLTSPDDEKRELIKVLKNNKTVAYQTEKMLYIFLPHAKKTIGISIGELSYIGKTAEDAKGWFNLSDFVPETFLTDDIFKEIPYRVPFLYYLASF